MAFYERSELFGKYPKTPVFDHSNYRLFERIPAVPGTSNNRDLTVFHIINQWVVRLLGCCPFLGGGFLFFDLQFIVISDVCGDKCLVQYLD